jgi:FkbM family methyltransferase
MGANSFARRIIKGVLRPVLNDRTYHYFQALAMAWDIRSGGFSEPELDVIPFAVKPGETVLDIGANYGLYSYHLSRMAGPAGRVYAFEPVPFTVNTLRLVARILRFQNVEIVPKGCSDHTGKISFTVPVQASGASAAGLAHISGRNDDRAGKETQVRWGKTTDVSSEVVALDEYLAEIPEVSFIKCDIEGSELLAFRGAEKIITKSLCSVLCEINPWYLDGFGLKLQDLVGFFFEKGYSLYVYNFAEHRLEPVKTLDEIGEYNYFFIHPSRLDRFAPLLVQQMSSQSLASVDDHHMAGEDPA